MRASWVRLDRLEQELQRCFEDLSKNDVFSLSVKAQQREDALRNEMTPIVDSAEFQRRVDATPERQAHLKAFAEFRKAQAAIVHLEQEIEEELAFEHSSNRKAQIALQQLRQARKAKDGTTYLRILGRLRASRRDAKSGSRHSREHSKVAAPSPHQAEGPGPRVDVGEGTAQGDKPKVAVAADSGPKPKKCDLSLLLDATGILKRVVTPVQASAYGLVGMRAIQKAIKKGSLETEGKGPNRRIIVQSLLAYYPPEEKAN
jgi:hypothetical protein